MVQVLLMPCYICTRELAAAQHYMVYAVITVSYASPKFLYSVRLEDIGDKDRDADDGYQINKSVLHGEKSPLTPHNRRQRIPPIQWPNT